MYNDKRIINEAELQDLIEVEQRRAGIVDWLTLQSEVNLDLAEQWSWMDADKAARYFETARWFRMGAESIADRQRTSDWYVNMIYLGEIEL